MKIRQTTARMSAISALTCCFFTSLSVQALELDPYGSLGEGQFKKSISCAGVNAVFERTKSPQPVLSLQSRRVVLEESCYASMSCTSLQGRASLLLVMTPACGGNGVPESYEVYDLDNAQKKSFNYVQAKNLGLIKD
jgi:hypothetical protein